jgi:hypothetical protein
MEKKEFKETGLGKILLNVLPGIAKGASKMLPNSGVLGVIKNLIDSDPDMTEEEKAAAHDQLVELYRLEVEDRDSARKREAAIAASGGRDWMMSLTGIIGLAAVTTQVPETNKEIFIHMIGIVEGVALSIFGYYFGSAVKKDDKNG